MTTTLGPSWTAKSLVGHMFMYVFRKGDGDVLFKEFIVIPKVPVNYLSLSILSLCLSVSFPFFVLEMELFSRDDDG